MFSLIHRGSAVPVYAYTTLPDPALPSTADRTTTTPEGSQIRRNVIQLCITSRKALAANLLLYPPDVRRIDLVPCRHVFLHARCEACLLAAREGAARLGDTALEALLVDVLETMLASSANGYREPGGGREEPRGGSGIRGQSLRTSISVRAFAVLVACSACLMMAFLTESESMVAVCWIGRRVAGCSR